MLTDICVVNLDDRIRSTLVHRIIRVDSCSASWFFCSGRRFAALRISISRRQLVVFRLSARCRIVRWSIIGWVVSLRSLCWRRCHIFGSIRTFYWCFFCCCFVLFCCCFRILLFSQCCFSVSLLLPDFPIPIIKCFSDSKEVVFVYRMFRIPFTFIVILHIITI